LQSIFPCVHPQVPFVQCCPPVHAVPHAPQFASFDVKSTHALLQSVRLTAHDREQTPREQRSIPWHAFPHDPQLFGSDPTSTQFPLHTMPVHTPPSLGGTDPSRLFVASLPTPPSPLLESSEVRPPHAAKQPDKNAMRKKNRFMCP
jgi:hypothetical protein